jgi:ADP-ribose pyrophosphatase YjhB (NUDIX family)
MNRTVRYQGAIVRDGRILLVCHRENRTERKYWLLPGGGREEGESEEECVRREMLEETSLDVVVDRRLPDESTPCRKGYRRHRTFLCHAPTGEPRPGYEPEPEAAALYAICAVRWVDLRRPETWGREITEDPLTMGPLEGIRKALGYDVPG